jgi:UDP-glucose 4-epimerase
MNVLVTGGAGFIGSNLVKVLLRDGHSVTVLDDLSSGKKENLPPDIPLKVAKVGDPETWKTLEPVDTVFHLAAMASVVESQEKPVQCQVDNVHSILYLLDFVRSGRAKRIVFASSASIYGDLAPVQIETQLPAPKSPYGLSKLTGESLLQMAWLNEGIPYLAFRMFNVYGPYQSLDSDYASVIPVFLCRALQGKPLMVHGKGDQTRDFISVSQVVEYYLQAMMTSKVGIYNLGNGGSETIKSLAQRVLALTGREDLEIQLTDSRPGDIHASQACIDRLKKDFQAVDYDFEKSLEETCDYYREKLKT